MLKPIPGQDKFSLESDTADAYSAMLAAARADGISYPSLTIVDAWRSTGEQTIKWQGALSKYGNADEARKHVAPPGHSFHERGTAIDLNLDGLSMNDVAEMKSTAAYKWLVVNAPKYGFRNLNDIRKGAADEPWHWEHGSASVPYQGESTGSLLLIAGLAFIFIGGAA